MKNDPRGTAPYENNQPNTDPHEPQLALQRIDQLTSLVADANKGFDNARENVQSTSLESLFDDMSTMHDRHYRELTEILQHNGTDIDNGGTLAGALHRTWIGLKSTVTGGDEVAILKAVQFGESQLDEAYEAFINEIQLPTKMTPIKDTIMRQHTQVHAAVDRINRLTRVFEA
jgi:uncharacterized protein (TIGR02284 family)